MGQKTCDKCGSLYTEKTRELPAVTVAQKDAFRDREIARINKELAPHGREWVGFSGIYPELARYGISYQFIRSRPIGAVEEPD